MKQTTVTPDYLTFPFVVKACTNLNTHEQIHTHILKSHFSSDNFVNTAIVDMYIKCRRLDTAHSALALFRLMRMDAFNPDALTIIGLAQFCAEEKNVGLNQAVHCIGFQIGVERDLSVTNTLISTYAKCQVLAMAELVFDDIAADVRSVVSWNSMIAGYAFLGRYTTDAGVLFGRMVRDGVMPDVSMIRFETVLRWCFVFLVGWFEMVQAKSDGLYGAMCASPAIVLEPHGLLKGKKATAYPAMCDKLLDQSECENGVVVDG